MDFMGAGAVQWGIDKKRLLWFNLGVLYADVILPINARVLDVGGGHDPHPAADIILDKFIDDNEHRPGSTPISKEQELITMVPGNQRKEEIRKVPIVCADALHLPFSNKSFDFIIAKDVLEHIDDIRGAMAEISRVGKAGFIDVPRIASEMLFPQGNDVHKWVFEKTDHRTIRARSVANLSTPFGTIMHKIFQENKDVQRAWSLLRHYFHLYFLWEESIDCEIGEEITGA